MSECVCPPFPQQDTCKQSCLDYCSGRGLCRKNNTDVCDCFDPVRWHGDRCEISVCGEHGLVVGGDYTAEQTGPIVCGCAPGWSGPGCSVHMNCVWGTFLNSNPPKCVCQPGYSGADCTVPIPEPIQVGALKGDISVCVWLHGE